MSVSVTLAGPESEPGENQAVFYEEDMCLRSLVWLGAMYSGTSPNYTWSNFPKANAWVEPNYVFRHASAEGCSYIPYRPALWDCIDFNDIGAHGNVNWATRRITHDHAAYDLEYDGEPNFLVTGLYFENLIAMMGDTFRDVPFTIFFTFTSSRWKMAQFSGSGGPRTGNTQMNNRDIYGELGYMVDSDWDKPWYQYVGRDAGYTGPICPS